MFTFLELEKITGGELAIQNGEWPITHLLTDSRKSVISSGSIFFAIKGVNHNGHDYIADLYQRGIRQFVIQAEATTPSPRDANILVVPDTVKALQDVAEYHRRHFDMPVIGIAGSNGKTIVKEWLGQMLSTQFKVVRNPKSYNSQIGVPLAIWEMNHSYEMGVFEAGISQPGEMENLERIIKPSSGIFTNIGSAHEEGFESIEQKIREKAKLFAYAPSVIYCKDYPLIDYILNLEYRNNKELVSWSFAKSADYQVLMGAQTLSSTRINIEFASGQFSYKLPFTDKASLENCIHGIVYLMHNGWTQDEIQEGLKEIMPISMRLELKQGINRTMVIDDTYNNDLAGLRMALEFMNGHKQKEKRTLILSDILQAALVESELYQEVAQLVASNGIDRLIGIGEAIGNHKQLFPGQSEFFKDSATFHKSMPSLNFEDELILIKGARPFHLEKVVQRLEQRTHDTRLEINLDALTHNLNFYRSRLAIGTRVMAMVKAFAYGGGLSEIANLLQFHRLDYLGVAFPDEGVELRRNGVHMPIMVMNTAPQSFEHIHHFDLEPEIYSLQFLKEFGEFCNSRSEEFKIHLKLDTGMHRLGIKEEDLGNALNLIKARPNLKVISVFSHLAAADDDMHEGYSKQQAATFDHLYSIVTEILGHQPIKHLVNSSGIIRYPEYQYDMVRLGIGLYGIEMNSRFQRELRPVGSLKTTVSQIKRLAAGDTVGYGRAGKVERDTTIAIIAIGYADGFVRGFSCGIGKVIINGQEALVIGRVCMDMTMVDVTDIDAAVGDEVTIFGEKPTLQELASSINTIPYEILTGVSERVKRVFYSE